MKLLLLLFLAVFLCSCTTLPNRWDPYSRRDLYSPESVPSHAVSRQIKTNSESEPSPEPKPEFR